MTPKTSEVTGIGVGYKQLEERASCKRAQIVSGKASLISAVQFLSTTDEDFLMKNYDVVAKHSLVSTQMFSESFRERDLPVLCLSEFENYFITSKELLIRAHG